MGLILVRSLSDDLKNFTKTFTSFDQCMSQNICKIPFIVGCVVGGIIIVSIIWCLARCCFCGYACCACCCGGCGGSRNKTLKYDISPPGPLTVPPYVHEAPQYAYFDSKSDDALPVMPSIEQRSDIEVYDCKESHEMGAVQTPTVSAAKVRYGTPIEVVGRSPQQIRLSSASSLYSAAAFGQMALNNSSPQHQSSGLTQPQPYFINMVGHRNTVQNRYNDVPLNPYQYQGPRRQEQQVPYDPQGHRRPEEWSVI
ncbi:hypothetical protein EDC01DRAFT_445191 [Geopyxis carbonaria]|nr:hypothetical protein EDC01DRAFT_445191 [Geopyxis carbonaria]